ncbi:MAG: hypothetical protein WEB58_22585 [Planctomycetaceae bacterium]
MIDQAAREQLRIALSRLIDGEMTTREFEEYSDEFRWLEDAALPAAIEFAERFFDTEAEYFLTGRNVVGEEAKQIFARWNFFLKSNLAYGWPRLPNTFDLLRFLSGLALLGIPAGIAVFIVSVLMFAQGDPTWGFKLLIPAALIEIISIGLIVAEAKRSTAEMNEFRRAVDFDVWPFLTLSEYETFQMFDGSGA